MTTNKEIIDRLDKAATDAENTTDVYLDVLTSEGEQDIPLPLGGTTPNLNKRLAGIVQAVTSVNGKDGDVSLTRDDVGVPTDNEIKRFEKEARFVKDASGETQQQINDDTYRKSEADSNFATKQEIVQGVHEFDTYALFNAAKETLPINCTVIINEENTGEGQWGIGNNSWNGSVLKKSAYDPLTKANKYTDTSINIIKPAVLCKNIVTPTHYLDKFVNSSTGVLTNSNFYDCFIFNVIEFGKLYVTTYSTGSSGYPVVFLSASDEVIGTSLNLLTEYFDEPVNIPPSAAQVAINFRKAAPTLKTVTLKQDQLSLNLANDVKDLSTVVSSQDAHISANTATLSTYIDKSLTFVDDYYVTSTGVVTAATGQRYAEVSLGSQKHLKITTKTTNANVPALVFVDETGVSIGTLAGNQTYTDHLITAPSRSAKFYLNHRQDFSVVPKLAIFDVYPTVAKDVLELKSQATSSKWKGKKWATLGDSITAMATWQAYVNAAHGFIWTNFGIGGTKISGSSVDANAMCQDTRINAIPINVDLITLMGGTNDWAQNTPLGTITSTDPTTFYGALNTFAQKAFARWPAKRIAIATTPYGEIPAWESRPGWTSPAHNALGLTTNDYAEAIRIFCRHANIACIEVAQNAGYGTHNITVAMGGSESDHLHPAGGSIAAKGIGSSHVNALWSIEPV